MNLASLPLANIVSGNNPRSEIGNIDELVASIEQVGVLEPIRVVQSEENGAFYRIESGHRRYNAALALGHTDIPAILVDTQASDEEFVRAIVTNVQREDLNVIDEALAYQALEQQGWSRDGIASRLGVARSRVTQRLELLELPAEVQRLFQEDRLPLSARTSLIGMAKVSTRLCIEAAKLGAKGFADVLMKEPGRLAAHVAKENPKHFMLAGFDVLKQDWEGNWELRPPAKATKALQERIDQLVRGQDLLRIRLVLDEQRLDEANALGVLYRGKGFDEAILCDVSFVNDRLEDLVAAEEARVAQETKAAAKRQAEQLIADGKVTKDGQPTDLADELKEFRRGLREAQTKGREAAAAANAELATVVMRDLASYAPAKGIELPVARALAWAIVEPSVDEVFRAGLRVVLPQFRSVEKTGAKGDKEKTVYAGRTKGEAAKLAREWLHAAESSEEAIGRALAMCVCAIYADQGVLPKGEQQSQNNPFGKAPLYYDQATGRPSSEALPVVKEVAAWAKSQVPKALTAKVRPSDAPVQAYLKKHPELAAKANVSA
jgi:ParB/RepB/Spo0J family partition protein